MSPIPVDPRKGGQRSVVPEPARRRRPGPSRYAVAPVCLLILLLAGSPGAAGAAPAGPHDAGATSTGATVPTPDDAAVTTDAPAAPTTQAEARPRIRGLATPLGQVADGVLPTRDSLSAAVSDELASDWLGPEDRRAVTIRDAMTGEHLADRNADLLVTPASTTKILAAAAVVQGLPPGRTFTTRVVAGTTPQDVVLVAGGDMLLARGEGDPEQVAGRLGAADLAARTARSLQDQGVTGPVTVHLDLDHVAGPDVLDSWTDFWVSEGYTGRVVQLGLAEDIALPQAPSPADPPQEVARAFRDALVRAGVEVSGEEEADVEVVSAVEGAAELASGESAPVRDVLALALATSDNAMVEQLARQAAAEEGVATDRASVTGWIRDTVQEAYGVDLTGAEIADASGLSDGTRIPVSAVADVLVAGADGQHPALQEVLAAGGLPIAGYTGTLATRFHLPVHAAGVGNARAKTGSLPNVTSLAGTVVTAEGRLLVFAMTADRIGEDGAVLEARSALDEVVAQLARCGC
ncbi:D-alanyl-D-alanine carboxypeptidase/D-alanyl-D-alanine-endopeptidase [Ornithinimicrobium cerasi]|uniref:D-alanyl-D-alanine carboxypeptidase/D-alanyl-D-alanine-endopeptidase n=1 Tax=Ornithinimicrobium cerasi TaxID=2248773 RepID=UPI0013796A93|nr:D-alanyl-D-alanine carboxypeptidase [Ornithinimicrobium cerasi]